jgi:hypothetical protein
VGLANLCSESETCVGSRVHLVGVSISFEKNFYRLPFTPPSGLPYRSFTNAAVKTIVGTTNVVSELPRGLGTSGTESVLPTRQNELKRILKSIVILAILFESKS